MTKQELNRDIKRLAKKFIKMSAQADTVEDYYFFRENAGDKEFKRLYYADRDFSSMSRVSVLLMFRMNLKYRFIPMHVFGMHIEIEKLL